MILYKVVGYTVFAVAWIVVMLAALRFVLDLFSWLSPRLRRRLPLDVAYSPQSKDKFCSAA